MLKPWKSIITENSTQHIVFFLIWWLCWLTHTPKIPCCVFFQFVYEDFFFSLHQWLHALICKYRAFFISRLIAMSIDYFFFRGKLCSTLLVLWLWIYVFCRVAQLPLTKIDLRRVDLLNTTTQWPNPFMQSPIQNHTNYIISYT